MRIQFQEWGRVDQFGDRDDMGVHFYTMSQAQAVIDNGGILDTADTGAEVASDYAVRRLFGDN